MPLYVINVPQPPAGFEFSYTIPGQYLENIKSVTATLTCANTQGPMVDSSGNGLNGQYVNLVGSGPVFTAGLVAGDDAYAYNLSGTRRGEGTALGYTLNTASAFSIEFWLACSSYNAAGDFPVFFRNDVGNLSIQVGISGGPPGNIAVQFNPDGFVFETSAGVFPADGNGHHIVITWSGTTGHIYLDGANQTTFHFGSSTTHGNIARAIIGGPFGSPGGLKTATADEFAIYYTELSAARVSAHFTAASTSFTAYTAAVLADSPAGYYHLDDVPPTGGRTPNLTVTNGMVRVLDIDSGFTAPASGSVYNFSWLTDLSNNSQTNNGANTLVGIPPMVLPAGYVIGSLTPDLKPTDQWSNVIVWWDSDIMDGMNGVNRYAWPPPQSLVLDVG